MTESTPHQSGDNAPAEFDVPRERRPRHIAIIMDGNGRWAGQRNMNRSEGHRAGAEAARKIVQECGVLEIDALTLYSFSMENWKRPAEEVDALMGLLLEYLPQERGELITNNVRFQVIGARDGLDDSVIHEIELTEDATRECSGLHLVLAINYSSREELTRAARRIAQSVSDGDMRPDEITEETISSNLYTNGIPDPDLLIRTSGEHRVSNYLLWQISYAEIHMTDLFWPDFDETALHAAIRDFASRQRRYGAVEAR